MKSQRSLYDLENKFQNYLLSNNQDIFNHVIGTCKVPADIRLKIYEHAYRARLHEALVSTYPILQSCLGEEPFEKLCYDFIDANPSQFRSIRWYGDILASFIRENPHYQAFPYLSELATLEWTMSLVFDAADSPVIQLQDMQPIPPEAWSDMRLQFHPSVHRLSLCWNTVQIWQTITAEQQPAKPQKDKPVTWLLWRKDLVSQYSSLSEDEAWAIDMIIKQAPFGELCEGLCQWVDEQNAGMHAASLLKGWITAGLIATIRR